MFSKLLTALMILLAICCVFWVADLVVKEEKALKDCFFQSPKTPECEYKLWKYENRDKTDYIVVNGRM